MRQKPIFKLICTMVLCLYTTITAQAGQLITKEDRDWAKQTIAQEANLGTIESSKSVAVLNFRNLTSQKRLNALQKGMAMMLANDLAKVDGILVIDRTKMQALVDEIAPGGEGLVEGAVVPRVGRLLRSYYLVNGSIKDGTIEQLEINSSLIDVPFKGVKEQATVAGNLDELFRMEKDVLFNVLDDLNVYLSKEKKRQLEVPISLSTTAMLALFVGIDLADQGQYGQAAEMYNRAIAEDPSLDVARDALKELNGRGLLAGTEAAKTESSEPSPEAEDSGWSSNTGTILGIAAVGGGIALLAVAAGSSGGGDSTTPEPPATIEPTVSPNKTEINCVKDSITFSFAKPMNPQVGSIAVDPSDFGVSVGWDGTQTYTVSWDRTGSSSDYCTTLQANGIGALSITFNNFMAEDNVTPLGGVTTYNFNFSGYVY